MVSKRFDAPTLGSNMDFFTSAQVKGSIRSDDLIGYLLDQLEEESGAEVRKQAEDSKQQKGTQTTIRHPSGFISCFFPS